MILYPIVIVIHILSAIAWLSFLPIDYILRKSIRETQNITAKKELISIWLKTSNLLGIIGMAGILVTGIAMVSMNDYYSFFQFSMNHWLATKQVFMVVIIISTFAFLIPNAKKLAAELLSTVKGESTFSTDIDGKVDKIGKILSVINVLVLINLLLAVTHKYI